MGMNINVGMKQDYSYLFQNMSGGSTGNLNFLSDYASIRNGSYGKLMKAYYGGNGAKEISSIAEKNNTSSTSAARDSVKTLSSIKSAADDLKGSADALTRTGSKSVFNKVDVETKDEKGVTGTRKDYDTDAIYSSVSAFVDDYNKVMKQASAAESSTVQNRGKALAGITNANKNLLEKVGITINEDKTLSIDEKAFKAADMTQAKSLFNGNSSYADRVSAQATMMNRAAESEASKSATYDWNGSYNKAYTAGNMFDYGF